ncbi:beta-lactamase family protein [Myxococcota bacterium]|nr:beta-lactamase family protein [Myxococcota bacterium]
MMETHGHCDDRFARVRDAFEENFTQRGDIGACFAVTLEGEYVVDIWGGHRDTERSKPWQEDTIVNVYSTTKTMTFLSALMLSDRGQLDLEAPVADYWPEFAARGKENVRVKHCLSHSAGLPGFSRPFENAELYDWDFACADLAGQAPWWEPGAQSGYHAITQGYLIGEVIRRITGKSFGTFFREEVAEKVGADFHIGVDRKHFDRIADLASPAEDMPILEMDPESIPGRVFTNLDIIGDTTRTDGWRQAEIPAANGHGNARSVVRAQTAMANGGSAFGEQLLSAEGCQKALELQTDGMDAVLMQPVRFAMGYALPSTEIPVSPSPHALWWGGAGGSTIVVDLDTHLCFSYVMNQMTHQILGDPRGGSLGKAVYESLGL